MVLHKGVAVAIERLRVENVDEECAWGIMDCLCDRGPMETQRAAAMIYRHAFTLMTGGGSCTSRAWWATTVERGA
eukprot:1128603-Lingulodinium_polyedra.AAC.1